MVSGDDVVACDVQVQGSIARSTQGQIGDAKERLEKWRKDTTRCAFNVKEAVAAGETRLCNANHHSMRCLLDHAGGLSECRAPEAVGACVCVCVSAVCVSENVFV